MRLFVAIDLPDDVRDALGRVQAALPFGRATEPETLHLTLAFLGELSDPEAEAADDALSTLNAAPFALRLAGLDCFGTEVLWAGVADPAPVTALQARVRSALHGAGIMLERRRFRPHVTLARFAGSVDAGRLATFLSRWQTFDCPPVEVDAITLFRSTLTRHGAHHEALARYPLGPARLDESSVWPEIR